MEYIAFIFCGFLGAWGGADGTSKTWRRFGIPLVLIAFHPHWILGLLVVPLYLGYGIPDEEYYNILPVGYELDKGSALGRFYCRIFNDIHLINFFTRATIGLLSAVIIYTATGQKLAFVIPLVSGFCGVKKNIGTLNVFGKELNWVEIITYSIYGIGVL